MDSLTKHLILSVIAKLYDPMGWLSLVVIVAKSLIQAAMISKTTQIWRTIVSIIIKVLLNFRQSRYCDRLGKALTI